jgi:sortase (surface protein transpeptidase)
VPEDWDDTGWYTGRSVPGEIGTSVVVGHVDSAANGAAVFFYLDELLPADLVEVVRSDGSIARFAVTEVTRFSKNDFPTDRVYAQTEMPSLRLITCGGAFDREARSYTDNVVVFAEYLDTQLPARRRS